MIAERVHTLHQVEGNGAARAERGLVAPQGAFEAEERRFRFVLGVEQGGILAKQIAEGDRELGHEFTVGGAVGEEFVTREQAEARQVDVGDAGGGFFEGFSGLVVPVLLAKHDGPRDRMNELVDLTKEEVAGNHGAGGR